MSKIFYDKLISFEEIEKEIANISKTFEEKEELWDLVDGLMHHKILLKILDNLETKHHEEFLVRLYNKPHDGDLLKYLEKKLKADINEFFRVEAENVLREIISDIKRRAN